MQLQLAVCKMKSMLIIILVVWRASAHVRYVKPDNFTMASLSCPGQPCLTLDQYTQQYFSTGSIFLFLLGNHTLLTTIKLTGISDIEFRSMEYQSSAITIIHGNGGIISFSKGINLKINGLTLKTTSMNLFSCKNIVIANSIFLGSSLRCKNSSVTVVNCYFKGSLTQNAISASYTKLNLINSNFIGNAGGAVSIVSGDLALTNCNFITNSAFSGGAIYAKYSNVTIKGSSYRNSLQNDCVSFSENMSERGGAIFLDHTTAIFKETLVIFERNRAILGGGIFSTKSSLNFTRTTTLFIGNTASRDGGAIWLAFKKITFSRYTASFINNKAHSDGGALYESNTIMEFNGNINFSNNSAERGGGMFLLSVTLKFASAMNLTTSYNNASKYGGVIYYEDTLTFFRCTYTCTAEKLKNYIPYCFIQFIGNDFFGIADDTSRAVYSYYNSAGRYGSFLYGGGLDRCQLKSASPSNGVQYFHLKGIIKYLQISSSAITSQPYKLCFCGNNEVLTSCYSLNNITIETNRGQNFNVSLYAIAQGETEVSTTVTARTSITARLKSNQTSLKLSENCSILTYNLYSTENNEELVLHPDGLCSDKGKITVNVKLEDCPPGFILSKDECICDYRLIQYNPTCTINKDITITQNSDSRFWMNALYENGTYYGLILCDTCPVEYCKTETGNISLDKPDFQCEFNHSGMVCGACIINHSLMLGSSRCKICPNIYLALLLPFAAAGIALIVFLAILRLTVDTGMINSVILYCNIIQVNGHLFFSNNINVLTVFIAWMNLDLGIETCFYNGMTAYAQTWLQFAFPIYIWILITLIIIASRYSVRVSKLIGHNPIAVLATLLLMSYTKILKIIIDVYSSATLEYPDNKTVAVWLKDGNVPYLQPWHLLLTVVTSLVLVFLFLPYTLLLLLGYKLYRFSGRKYMRWLNRLKPLLDSYYAPCNKHTRCWTGFLLLVRCALYIVFSFEEANRNLLAITITFIIIVVVFALPRRRIYSSSYINIIESLVYSNLSILSVITLTLGSGTKSQSSAALVYSLVGMVFVIMMGIIVYNFHNLYIAHTFCLRIQVKISKVFNLSKVSKKEDEIIPKNTPKEVTTTLIELREPLLET